MPRVRESRGPGRRARKVRGARRGERARADGSDARAPHLRRRAVPALHREGGDDRVRAGDPSRLPRGEDRPAAGELRGVGERGVVVGRRGRGHREEVAALRDARDVYREIELAFAGEQATLDNVSLYTATDGEVRGLRFSTDAWDGMVERYDGADERVWVSLREEGTGRVGGGERSGAARGRVCL